MRGEGKGLDSWREIDMGIWEMWEIFVAEAKGKAEPQIPPFHNHQTCVRTRLDFIFDTSLPPLLFSITFPNLSTLILPIYPFPFFFLISLFKLLFPSSFLLMILVYPLYLVSPTWFLALLLNLSDKKYDIWNFRVKMLIKYKIIESDNKDIYKKIFHDISF